MEKIKPKRLEPGDTIGVVAPSSPAPPEVIQQSIKILKGFGYRVKLGKSVGQVYGYLSGSDETRAQDILDMFIDPEVKAIFSIRGGYGTPRILDLLDYDLIQRHPKIFVGYSDITGLHTAIHKHTGLVTFHGPMVGELVEEHDPLTCSMLFHHLTDPASIESYCGREEDSYTITPGVVEGEIIGGNLSLLVATLGTPYEIDTKDKILFIEDVSEEPYSIDRMLTQLKLAGKLTAAKGIVITDFSDIPAPTKRPSLTIDRVLQDILAPLHIPCFYGMNIGHCQPNLAIPIGISVRLHATERKITFLEKGVI
ncbi:S66 peptidase family protein [Thermoflavimicrobium dichotomicum]|uniref:Muramoyltetrapeptide carboxypeptidase n=1 Tax=Thermoflavimicrobium dichotomicum TaxID=46223 RepID=A0A1I3U3Y9_9BACL|nr:LD-carboxypeptidase [Thermoflavimicrobium dichotomicum]SFJ77259.1 muramoyltetrapeptide carboxypeptidase [Thermoflavimicrobium dichotomicum]